MTQNTFKTLKNRVEIVTSNTVSNKEMGYEMKKPVGRLELVHVSRNIHRSAAALPASALREATTGRPVAVPRTAISIYPIPRIMAVAEPVQPAVAEKPQVAPTVELAFYRKYTEAMLRRYTRISMQPGRTPSLLGRELFRGDSTHSTLNTFEDGVAFCIDIERCLAKLRKSDQCLLQRIAIQGYTHEEAAPLLGLSFKWCVMHYGRALDRFTGLLLAARLMDPQNCCQHPETVEN